MNHTYRLVFNAVLGTCVPAPETAHGAGKGRPGGARAGALRAAGNFPGTSLRPLALACALACGIAPSAFACDASDTASLAACVANAGTDPTINITANITLTGPIGVLPGNATIVGNGHTIDGAGTYGGFSVAAGTANVSGLTLVNMGTTQLQGGNLAVGNAGSLGTGSLSMAGGRLTALSTMALAPINTTFASNTTNTVAAAAGTTLTLTTPTVFNPGTSLRFGTAADTGTVVLHITGGAVASGALFVDGGTLRAGNANLSFVANLMPLTVQAGATLDSSGFALTAQQLNGGGNVITSAAPGITSTIGSGNFSGVLSGADNVAKTGTGTLVLSGNNTYAGTTTINAGTLRVGNGGTSGSLGSNTGAIVNNGSLVFDRADSVLVANQVTGSGALTQAGTGTLILTGANDYTGATVINNGGTLQVGNGGTTGTLGTGSVVNNGSLVFNRSDGATVGNTISGSGSVTKSGAGTLVLTGANAYTGTTTINAGTLQVGDGGTTGSLGTGNVVNNGALVFDRSDTAVVNNAISGSGSLRQDGGGTLTLVGSNSYTGGTNIAAGTLQVGNGGTTGTLGGGAVTNSASLVFNRSDTYVVNNAISGTGSVTQNGTGTLVLNGANGYLGGTRLNAGTIEVGTSAALGAGPLNFAGGALRATQSHSQSNGVEFAAGSTSSIRAAAGQTFELNGFTRVRTGAQLRFGSATDTGTVVVGAAGGVVEGPSTQQLWVDGGTLTSNSGLLAGLTGSAAATHVASGATLDFAGQNAGINNLQGLGTVQTGTGYLVLSSADFGGVIDGTGGLRKDATGTAILHGANTYSGGTLVQQGVLQVGNGGNTGQLGAGDVIISVGGTLRFARNDTNVVDNLIAGSVGSTLEQSGTGTTVLTGDSSFNGTVNIDAGTLQLGNGGTSGALGSGAINNDGTLVFNRSDNVIAVNAIDGSGSVRKTGTGSLTLAGNSTYAGGTTIDNGEVVVTTNSALGSGTVTLDGGQLTAGADVVLANAIVANALRHNIIAANTGTTLSLAGALDADSNTLLQFGTTGATGTVRLDGTVAADAALTQVVVAGGTLTGTQLGSLTANSRLVTVDAPATLAFEGAADVQRLEGLGTVVTPNALTIHQGDFQGRITGAGSVVKQGLDNLLLTGDNDYTGGTTINGGMLRVGAGGTAGSLGTGAVTNDGLLVFHRSDTHEVANAISGSGTVGKAGSGTTILTGNNSYTGATIIGSGTLQVGNGGNAGTLGTGAVVNDGALVFNRNDTLTVANAISGSGTLTQAGTGTTVLAGNNSYAGATAITAGTLQVGAGGTSGALGTAGVTNNGVLAFNRSDAMLVANAIGGTGSVAQIGTGTTVLAGNNSYAGATTISAGTLQVGNGGASGTLGTGGVTNNGFLDFNRAGTLTVANTITGTGAVRQLGPGTLELNADNNYSGGTGLMAGTLSLGHDNALGTGVFVVHDGTTVTSTGSRSIANDVFVMGDFNVAPSTAGSLDFTGAVNLGGGARTITNTADGTSFRLYGAVSNGSALIFQDAGLAPGAGTVYFDLAGNTANTYAGETIVGTNVVLALGKNAGVQAVGGDVRVRNGGQLSVRSSEQISDGAAVRLEGNAYLRLGNGAVGITETIGTLLDDGTGNAQIGFLDSSQLHVGNGAFFGTVQSGGDLHKVGAGTLVLAGNNNHFDTVISGGTLQVGNGGSSGTLGTGIVANDGNLVFFRGDTFTVGNDISGTGTLEKAGAGTMILTGNNSYQGTTTISGGTLQVGAGGTVGSLGTGAVVNDGVLVFNRSNSLTVGGAISGNGSLTQAGAGTTILAGNNSYQGTTTISAGTLQVGAGGTAGSLGVGAVTNNGTLVFNRTDTLTVANAISGAGGLTHTGTGTTVLAGDNSYAGPTTIAAGTLQVGNGGTTGSLGSANVTNNGALAFNRSDTVSLANVINGTGSLTQAGSGNLVLTGANTYTGGTFVNAGTLSVNGSIVGNTTVNNGGTLGGTGSVGGVAIASGGTLAPGNSIGTLSVNGNLSFAPGSVYRVEANAAGAADRVNAVGAGTITINGGTVDVQAGGAGYQRNTTYTILSSGGATTGQFADATTNLAFLSPTLIYSANGVMLNLQASDALNYASVARTPNQIAVANHLQSFANTPGDAAALIQQIDNMTADQAAASFESMAGSAHASASQVAGALGRNFSATLASRSGFSASGLGNAMNDWSQVRYASLAPVETSLASAQERGLWAQALGAGGRVDADGNAAGSRYRNSGLVLGYDQPVTGQWLAGGAVGYSTSWWNATSGDPSSGKIESPQAGLYARYTTDSIRVRIDGTFSSHDFTTDRTVNIGGVGATANSKHKGREWGLAGQVEMPIKAGEWELRPLAGLRYAHLKENSFNETGQSPANLAVAERTTQNTLFSAGMHFVRPFNHGKAGLELRAVASHLAGDNDSPVTASLIGQPGSFTATGVPLERNALTLGTTVSGQFTRNVSAYLDANYEVRGSGQNAYQFTGGVRVAF